MGESVPGMKKSASLTFEDVCIFIIPKRLPRARIQKLYDIGKKRGMRTSLEHSDTVTHVVTALDSLDKVKDTINIREHQDIVSVDWLTSCFTENKVLRVTGRFMIGKGKQSEESDQQDSSQETTTSYQEPKYECMKAVCLNYKNRDIVAALEVLEKDAQYKGEEARALAFRRASCTIKSYDRDVKHLTDVSHLNYIGNHALRVIQDILENGISTEAEDIENSEKYRVLERLIGVYGCGPVTGNSWYNQGLKSLEDVEHAAEDGRITLTGKQEMGLKYYKDLNEPVDREECQKIKSLIQKEVYDIQSDATVELVGGQRRGKFSGHDVDVFICTKEDHQTSSLLRRLVSRLTDMGLILFVETQIGFNKMDNLPDVQLKPGTSNEDKLFKRRQQMDHLDKAFTILKCPSLDQWPMPMVSLASDAKRRRISSDVPYRARRVDLIVTPPSQYAISLLGWTGSKHFNRSLRLYAWRERNITISNHAIWDHNKQPPSMVTVSSEREIFEYLNIEYLTPEERNH